MDLDSFRADVEAWLAGHASAAPRDYGAILPPDLYDAGVAWQRLLVRDGWAGIHWPVEYGGRGLTAEHNAVWIEACARAAVPPVINMVGIVLPGGAPPRDGTHRQRERHLPPTLKADPGGGPLFRGPRAGSDPGGPATQ